MKKHLLLLGILWVLGGCGAPEAVIVNYQMPTKEQLYAATAKCC